MSASWSVAGHRVMIDLDGRGQSLRLLLGHQPGVRWYRKTGRERRELTDVLDATAAMPGFSFGPGIAHRDEMRRALESLRRSVDEDGSPESEFALALALALCRPRRGRACTAGRGRRRRRCDWSGHDETPPRPVPL